MRRLFVLCAAILLLAGCGGMYYAEKHLYLSGDNIKSPYGSGNLTLRRDVYFGRVPQNMTPPTYRFKGNKSDMEFSKTK